MIKKKDYRKVQAQLQAYLHERFEDVTVQIGDDLHYSGTNVVVTSSAFEGLFPEQRFHHLVRAIPADFYEQYLCGGVFWFELAPGETGRDLMKMPRSVDIAQDHSTVFQQLKDIGFAEKLQAALGSSPQSASIDAFDVSRRIMIDTGLTEPDVTRACLFLIHCGAFCDAQVLADVLPQWKAENVA